MCLTPTDPVARRTLRTPSPAVGFDPLAVDVVGILVVVAEISEVLPSQADADLVEPGEVPVGPRNGAVVVLGGVAVVDLALQPAVTLGRGTARLAGTM